MNIVLLEGLGVDKDFLDRQAAKLEGMGHTFHNRRGLVIMKKEDDCEMAGRCLA